MYAGFVGKTGVLAALMAQRGILGPRGCLGSKDGLFNVYLQGACDRQALVEDLGKEFETINLSFKPWPACALAHTYIDAMVGLRSEHSLRPEDIARIDVYSGEMSRGLCNPINIAAGKYPKTTNDAKRSIPFNVAVAALTGKVSFRSFTPEGLHDREVLQMAEKIHRIEAPEFDGEFTRKGNQLPPGKVAVTVKSGQPYTKQTDFPYGHHFNPIRFEDLVEKFRDCLAFSSRPIPTQNMERAIELILQLEEVADIREILQLLA